MWRNKGRETEAEDVGTVSRSFLFHFGTFNGKLYYFSKKMINFAVEILIIIPDGLEIQKTN